MKKEVQVDSGKVPGATGQSQLVGSLNKNRNQEKKGNNYAP